MFINGKFVIIADPDQAWTILTHLGGQALGLDGQVIFEEEQYAAFINLGIDSIIHDLQNLAKKTTQ